MNLKYCRNDRKRREINRIPGVYSLPTMVGDWENARAIEEAHMAVIAYKKARCQLLSGRTRTMLRNVLAPVTLSPSTGGIEFNKIYQIFSPSLPSHITEKYPYGNKGLYLSGMFTEHCIDKGTELMHGCLLSASSESKPSRRNTFIFRSNMPGATSIYYGDDVFIEINAGTEIPLYVQAENNTINTLGDSLQLRLTQQRDVYTYFKILHAQAKIRKDTIGMSIMPFENIVIQHVASGKNLAASTAHWVTTFFGVESMASCCTYKNSNRNNTAENMWQIIGHAETTKVTQP